MAARATFALKAGGWFRRDRLFIVSPDSRGTACPLSGRNSTYRPVQILEAGSKFALHWALMVVPITKKRDYHIDLQPQKPGRDLGIAFASPPRPAILDRDRAALDPAELVQPLYESGSPWAP